MTWRQYYEKFYDWADSTQRSRLSSVTDFSGAKAEEVIEIALAFVDEVPATRLMKKAIDSGVRFSAGCDGGHRLGPCGFPPAPCGKRGKCLYGRGHRLSRYAAPEEKR